MLLNKESIRSYDDNKNITKRLVFNGFSPNLYFTLNPHQSNCSPMFLMFHLKQALGRFYKKIHKRLYKYKDKQYPLIVFLENGRNRDIDEKKPHLHILIQIPDEKIEIFVDFVYNFLKQYYPSLTKYATIINTAVDLLQIWNYNDKEQTQFDMNPLMIANKIFTTADFQKRLDYTKENKVETIEEWYKSEPVFNPIQQTITDATTNKEKITPNKPVPMLHKIYNSVKSFVFAPFAYVGSLIEDYFLYYMAPVDQYYFYHIYRHLYEDLDDEYG